MEPTTEARLDAAIEKRGGRRITDDYQGVEQKIEVECSRGHHWEVKAGSILYAGTWCRHCVAEDRRIGLAKMREIAEARGGRCLSKRYKDNKQKLSWRCSEGHNFKMIGRLAMAGNWCPSCRKANEAPAPFKSFADALEHAKSNGGKHIGDAKALWTKTRWRCKEGHEFEVTGRQLMARSHFCKTCAGMPIVTLELIQDECRRRGGECLSPAYEGSTKFMRFRCTKGHVWDAMWKNVGSRGTWCPRCARTRGSLDDLHAIAARFGGRAISDKYVDCTSKYEWECANGHPFTATKRSANETWCTECSRPMNAHFKIAASHGGRCISTEKNLWECAFGHRWSAPIVAAATAWCPECQHGHAHRKAERFSSASP